MRKFFIQGVLNGLKGTLVGMAFWVSYSVFIPSAMSSVPQSSQSDESPGFDLTGLAVSKWEIEKSIPVCWENPTNANQSGRIWTQRAVENSWELHSQIRFSGWSKCKSNNRGIRIIVDDSGPHVTGLGRGLDGKKNGMHLNFTFNSWGQSCQSRKQFCIEAIALHEFGHALGFTHEHHRRDRPATCTDNPQGTTGDTLLTRYDSKSVMNYCNSYQTNLSVLDIEGLQKWYGKKWFTSRNNPVKLQARHSGMCWHTRAASKEWRAPVWTWGCSPGNGNHFKFVKVPAGGEYFKLQDLNSGLCLHVRAASKKARAPLWTWQCDPGNGDHFKFRKIPTSNGYFTLQAKHSGQCIHVKAASKKKRAPMWTWPCSRSEHFQFREIR